MHPNYLVIPLLTLTTATLGSLFTSQGMVWYRTISLPPWTPDGSVIGTVWTVLFILATVSALLIWNRKLKPFQRCVIVFGFLTNALLNVSWSFIFFTSHRLGLAVVEAGLLGLSVGFLIFLVKPYSRLAAFLMVPYLLWVSFATYLTYAIWQLNR
jgi:tryptophan-rich sensory protein